MALSRGIASRYPLLRPLLSLPYSLNLHRQISDHTSIITVETEIRKRKLGKGSRRCVGCALTFFLLLLQDMEKEIRKEVDVAIDEAKECPMPDASELFTNVYAKGFGVESYGPDRKEVRAILP